MPEELADAELTALIDELRRDPGPPARQVGVSRLRANSRQRSRDRPPGPPLFQVKDLHVPVPARLYRPGMAARPLVIYLHGGYFVFGDLDSHDRLCRRLALGADVEILAIDYRRAPEYPWPAAVDDAVDVVRWVTAHLGRHPSELTLAGDSAGGAIAALACQRLRAENGPQPAQQILINPHTDLTLALPSVEAKGTGYLVEAADLRWAVAQWVPRQADRIRASPLHAPDLAGLPAALIVTAEHDPLRDEGDAYAARLAAAGVRVVHRCEPGLVHGFAGMDTASPASAAAGARLIADIGQFVGPGHE